MGRTFSAFFNFAFWVWFCSVCDCLSTHEKGSAHSPLFYWAATMCGFCTLFVAIEAFFSLERKGLSRIITWEYIQSRNIWINFTTFHEKIVYPTFIQMSFYALIRILCLPGWTRYSSGVLHCYSYLGFTDGCSSRGRVPWNIPSRRRSSALILRAPPGWRVPSRLIREIFLSKPVLCPQSKNLLL